MKIDRKKVEIAMARACMSVNDIADTSGVNKRSVSKFLNGCEARPVSVGKIAKALGVDVTEIIAED